MTTELPKRGQVYICKNDYNEDVPIIVTKVATSYDESSTPYVHYWTLAYGTWFYKSGCYIGMFRRFSGELVTDPEMTIDFLVSIRKHITPKQFFGLLRAKALGLTEEERGLVLLRGCDDY